MTPNRRFLQTVIEQVQPPHEDAMRAARARQDRLTKPTGSLGVLEDLSVRLAGITGQALPEVDPPHIFIFAADHGVARSRGVSAYPPEVTAQMALNFARGGAVINCLARSIGAQLTVVDIGILGELPPETPVLSRKVRAGTADWTQGPAMSQDEALAALRVGVETFLSAKRPGLALIGEMGIGNTSTAVALTAALLDLPFEALVGRGTGVDDQGLARKHEAIEAGLARHQRSADPLHTLADLGGLEIAGMAGAMLAAGATRVPVVLDGLISTCAAQIACALCPALRHSLIAGHRSTEPAHTLLLNSLGLTPLLDLHLRLGEASGAALAASIVRASAAVLREVATFDEAQVSNKGQPDLKPG